MKILAINGSHRGADGHLGTLLERLFHGAQAEGAQCETIHLARKKVLRCLSCDRCHTPESYLQCIQREKDDVAAIFEAMKAADLLIFATPVYVFGMSGLMKTFLDRIYSTSDVNILRVTDSGLFFHHVDAAICSKPFVSLVCCDNLEDAISRNVTGYFRAYARFMDAPLVGELVRSGGRISGYGRNAARMQAWPHVAGIYAAFEQAGRELARDGRIRRATQRRAAREMVPVPFFGLLKRLPAFKKVMVTRAGELLAQGSE
jgi:NAD(P)H-dependent FMN reductase